MSNIPEWHDTKECEYFAELKRKGVGPMNMVQNVGSLVPLRVLLKKRRDPAAWQDFVALETHVEDRRNTSVWQYCDKTVKVFLIITHKIIYYAYSMLCLLVINKKNTEDLDISVCLKQEVTRI